MDGQPKIPTPRISPEQMARLGESARLMAEQVKRAAESLGRAAAQFPPIVDREKLAAIRTPKPRP